MLTQIGLDKTSFNIYNLRSGQRLLIKKYGVDLSFLITDQ